MADPLWWCELVGSFRDQRKASVTVQNAITREMRSNRCFVELLEALDDHARHCQLDAGIGIVWRGDECLRLKRGAFHPALGLGQCVVQNHDAMWSKQGVKAQSGVWIEHRNSVVLRR